MAKPKSPNLRANVLSLSRLHFIYAFLLATQIIIYDAWKLITLDAVLRRWIVVAILIVVTTVVWYLAHSRTDKINHFKSLIFTLILTDIFVASFSVYTQRGMAARAVMLYIVPMLVAAILISRTAIFATAVLCIAAYITTTVSYFVLNFNEGYKIELYGEVGFYSALFLLIASLITTIVKRSE